MPAHLPLDSAALAAFRQKHHMRRLALLGSVLREDFRANSDVDVLVTFDPAHIPGRLRLGQMQAELPPLLGQHPVDWVTEKFLNPRIRSQVLAAAEVVYAEG
jgi:hypothetical protein